MQHLINPELTSKYNCFFKQYAIFVTNRANNRVKGVPFIINGAKKEADMSKIIPKLGLDDLTDTRLGEYAQDKIEKINASPAFAAVVPSTAAVQTKKDDYENAVVTTDEGTKADTALKNQIRSELEQLLTDQAYHCAKIASGNLTLYLATGYEARGDTSLRFRNGFGGPWNVRMYDPHILEHTYEMRFYLERENTFGEELAKVAMMMAAREVNGVGSVFVYTNMEPGARRQGIKPEIIDIIKYRKPIAGISEKEAAIIQFGRELLGPGPVTPETFAHVRKLFGDKGIVQMTELISQYVVLGLVTKAFDMQNSPEQEAVRSEVAKVFGHE